MTDEPTFEEWSASHMGQLLRTAWLLTGDAPRAEDLVQEALLRCWPRWPRISRMDDRLGYVRKTLTRTYLASMRRKWRDEIAVGDLADGAEPAVALAGSGFELRSALLDALRRLPAGQRAVLVLRYAEDLSEAQTSAVLGISVGTVKSQASRGLRALRSDTRLLRETDLS